MGLIVCATRGGEGSRAAQLRAVELAIQSGSDLVFLYIVDTMSAKAHDGSLSMALEEELGWLGRVLLGVSEDRATRHGRESRSEIRTGRVHHEIKTYLRENDVDVLVLGTPRGTSTNVFGDDAIERFAHEMSRDTGVKVEIARPEDEP